MYVRVALTVPKDRFVRAFRRSRTPRLSIPGNFIVAREQRDNEIFNLQNITARPLIIIIMVVMMRDRRADVRSCTHAKIRKNSRSLLTQPVMICRKRTSNDEKVDFCKIPFSNYYYYSHNIMIAP